MQTMPLNAIVAAAKGANAAASGESAAAASAGAAPGAGAAPETAGDNSFGALLAQQLKMGVQTAPQQALPLDLLKQELKKAGDDPAQLAQDMAAAHPVDPNALMGLVAQALNNLNGRAAPSAAAAAEDNALSSVKTALDDGTKKTAEFTLPVADNASKQPAVKDDKAAVIAESGKMLPLEMAKPDAHGHDTNESMSEQFGDKLAAAQQAMAQGAPTVAASSPSGDGRAVRIDQTVGSPGWGGELGQKVVWMVGQQKQSAELQLNPPNLGPLEVRLTVNQDQMTATFVSHHGAVRDAIENALPKLREMLADNGISLGNVMVGADSFTQQQQQQQAAAQQNNRGTAPEFGLSQLDGDPVVAGVSGMTIRRGEGLVNTFV